MPSAKLKAAPAPPPSELGPVETACAAELERAGRTRTVPGQIALLLARRLDAGTADTGSSVAAVAKQLAVVMETATRGAEQNDNPLHRIRQQMRDRAAAEGRPDPYPNGVSVI